MTGIDNLAAQLQKTINEKDEGKKTGYDTQATVVKVSSDTIWVKIPGGVDETPVSKTVSAKEGDIVQVRVAGGRAWIVGNYTAPATDDTRAEEANTKAESADAHAAIAEVAAQGAQESAMTAQQAADVAKTRAIEAGRSAEEAKTMANEASAAASRANTAANGAVTSLGIVQGVVDGLSADMDEMQTHVAMMDAVVDPDSSETLVPAGLHVVPTSNGYFVVLSNDGMYVYDNESDLVAIFGENIQFDSIRPQRIGGDDAYIEYYDSNNDGKADSLRIVGANISSSTGIPTKVSELQNDSGYTTKTYVDDAVGDTATDLANYILSNDKAIDDLERQIDGAIDTWYYAVDPTTSNEPAKDWTTDALKESHLRDLYFNTSNGHTWRWAKDGSTYKWIQIEDADAIKALADAAKAQTTADVKKRVFISQPTPPYDVGDLWVGGSNGDIKKCKKAKTESQSYAASDWELASKYTDDSSLNDYKTEVSNTYSTKVEVQQTESTLEGKITAAESSSKSYADGLIEQEVSDRNTAIQASADGITTSVSQNYTKTVDLANTDAVKAAKKAGTDAQSALNSYKTTNDAAVAAAKKAGDDAQADLDDYKDTVQETYATKTQLTQTESSIKSEVSSTYATKTSVPTKVSQLTNDSKYATQTQAQGYANTAESNAKADATTKANAAEANAKADATTKANAAEANAKADTTEKLKSYSTTVQMNSAIEQKAGEISLAAAQTAEQNAKDYADGLDAKARPFVRGTQTAKTGAWTGVCDELTELKDGQEILYFLPYAGSGNATLNLTLKDGTTTGAINCYYSSTSRLTTHFGAGMTIPLVYHKNFTIGSTNYTGWWTLSQYNVDTYDRKRISNAVKVAEDIPQYIIAGRSGAGHKKLVGGLVVDLTYPICYLNQANASGKTYVVASGGTCTSFYTACPSVNLQNTKASWKGTNYSMCYIKGTLIGNSFTIHSDIFTTTVPTSDDGFTYIPIGMLYSDHQVDFACDNSLYGYRDNSFGPLALREASKLVSAAKAEIKVTTDGISSEVAKKVGSSEIISKINQSAEGIKIEAKNIEFKGSVVFNAIKSQTDAAYDAKGSASAVQTNLDNLEVGGRNLILDGKVERVSPGSTNGSAYVSPNAKITEYGLSILNNTDDWFTISYDYEVTGNTATNAYIYSQIKGSAMGNSPNRYVIDAPVGKYVHTFKLTQTQIDATGTTSGIRLRYGTDGAVLTVRNVKLEKGNKATDWTPAPEDVDASIEDVADSAAEALASASDDIYQKINDTDNEVATIQTNLAKYANRTDLNAIDAFVKKYLGDNGYVKIKDQGLVITQGRFSVVITGDMMIFQDNGKPVAYLSNQKLFITRSEVTQEMKIANFIWSNRNGRLTLMLAE